MTTADVPDEPLMKLELYLDINGPFNELYRKSDSKFSLATEQELEVGLAWWKKKVESGEAVKILEDMEAVRKLIGQTTSITSQK